MGLIPSMVAEYSPAGIVVERDTDAGLHFSGILTGVETSVTDAKYHVHGPNPAPGDKQGYTCETAGLGGHFYTGDIDVWSDSMVKVSLAQGYPLGRRGEPSPQDAVAL